MQDQFYQPRHAKRPDPAELPRALRGLADLIVVIDSTNEETS